MLEPIEEGAVGTRPGPRPILPRSIGKKQKEKKKKRKRVHAANHVPQQQRSTLAKRRENATRGASPINLPKTYTPVLFH